ncbi:MAG: DUF2283 domain-containing protein [Candidatus Poribacteria bacterium]
MKISYDREEDILMIEMKDKGTIDHAEQTDSFILHYDLDGEVLLIEILDASEFLSSLIKATISGKEQEISSLAR